MGPTWQHKILFKHIKDERDWSRRANSNVFHRHVMLISWCVGRTPYRTNTMKRRPHTHTHTHARSVGAAPLFAVRNSERGANCSRLNASCYWCGLNVRVTLECQQVYIWKIPTISETLFGSESWGHTKHVPTSLALKIYLVWCQMKRNININDSHTKLRLWRCWDRSPPDFSTLFSSVLFSTSRIYL